MEEVCGSDGMSTRNRETKMSELFLVSESENFNQILNSESDSLEFVNLNYNLKNIWT